MTDNSYKPKVIVLGIDGLEYSLVEKWKLKNIMQKSYCKTDLSDYEVIVTPPIWGSMLTGEIDEEIIKIWKISTELTPVNQNEKLNLLVIIGDAVLPFTIKQFIWDNIVGKKIGGNPFEVTANYVRDKNLTNIFDFFKKPWTNGIPGYGKNVSTKKDRILMEKAMGKRAVLFREHVIKKYKDDKEQLLNAIDKKSHDMIFWYTMILDKFGHAYMKKPLFLMNYYMEINQLVGKIKSQFKDSKIYVISDHGMKLIKAGWGMHSNYGFFSSNTGEKINKPYDLFNLVLKHKTK